MQQKGLLKRGKNISTPTERNYCKMKILVLAALIGVAISSGNNNDNNRNAEESNQIWQVGKLYRYNVETHTLARLHEGASTGSAFKARFIVRAKSPGRLQAKLENPQHAQFNQELEPNGELPKDIKYQPAQNLDKPFEINLEGGRVQSLSLPSSVPLAQENLLKGLIGALQVDLTPHRNVHSDHDTYDKRILRGSFRKMETDVTGDCETLYTVSPVASEWRRELPNFSEEEDPIEITKSKNYGHCHHRVDYHYGVPDGAEWSGTAHKDQEDQQLINRATVSRILGGKKGPIYKAETTSVVHVHPHLYGKQKAEVNSHVKLTLDSQEQDNEPEWEKPEGNRQVQNLLYSLTSKQVTIDDRSSSSASSESRERYNGQNQNQDSSRSRPRRSLKSDKNVAVKNNNNNRDHTSSSDSSSSSESNSAYINDDIPRSNEPAYVALYMNPQPHGDKKQNPMNAQKLVQEIAQLLQNPNNMPKGDFLSKFGILVRVIASMSSGQLSQSSRSIEIAKSSNNILKSDMWMVYRDAVAQAGTLPAFQQIKTWIQSKKLEGEEAAEVVNSLPDTLRYPTKELMTQFFDLAMSEEVRQQSHLNSSAVIAAARFINMGQVNNDTAHSFYPTHMYGRLSRKHDAFVLEDILPRLEQELDQAVKNSDRHKQQVYIKAIGNLGHRAILDVFAPYLEGRVTVSNYIRTQIVNSLRLLAEQKDNHARTVLYSILKNTAEPYEVRVAAINNILIARPSSPMMKSMAEMTHNDPSIQVRSALKSNIESAASLKSPQHSELARIAQAAKDMLTKEQFGKHDSYRAFGETYDSENQNSIFSIITTIGSADRFFPKQFRYSCPSRAGGWKKPRTISMALSSVQDLIDYYKEQLNGNEDRPNDDPNHKYSANKIAQMLNIKRNQKEPLAASFELNFMNEEKFFAYDENDLHNLAQNIKEYVQELQKGVDKHYTKVLNHAQVSVMFPVATGMPFIFKYKEPTVLHVVSKAKMQYNMPSRNEYSGSFDKTVQLTYAKNIDGSVGFLDTLANQHASAGVINKFQLYVPVKIQVQMKSGEVQLALSSIEPEQDHTILHYSSWPYTANQKKDSLTPVSQDPTTKLVSRNDKVVAFDSKYGQQVGVQFHVQGYSYSNDYSEFRNKINWNRPISNVLSSIYQNDIAQSHLNIKHLGKQSKNKEIKLTANYDTYYNQKQNGQYNPTAEEVKDVSPNSEQRRQELVKRAVTGINGARADVVDLSIIFDGAQKVEYVATAATGESPVDEKAQFAIFAGKNSPQQGNSQINAVGKLNKPEISSLNYQEALKKDLKIPFDIDIRYGQNGNIHINGQSERSKKYTEALKSQPRAKQCDNEIAQGNQYQEACYQMIIMSHAPDTTKATVTYKDVSPAVRNLAYQAYKVAEKRGSWQTEVNPLKTIPEGRLEISTDASYFTNSMNLALNSKYGEVRVKKMPLPAVTVSAASFYRPFSSTERVFNYYHRDQYMPYCSVEESKVKTFSGRSYDYSLSSTWHVVMQGDRKYPGQSREQFAILARKADSNNKQQELYISYQSENGKNLEIEVKPAPEGTKQQQVKATTNAKKVSQGDLTVYWDDEEEKPILQYHNEADGSLSLNIREDRLRIMYDGHRSVILNKDNRNTARGICGQMSGEKRDDYLTPNGLVDRPDHYGASFALDEENSDPKTKQLKQEAKEKAYQPEHQYTPILRSDDDWKNAMQASSSEEEWGSQNVYRSRSYSKQRGPCRLQQQVQYYENHGEICITTSPLNACQSQCRGDDYKVQATQVVCKPKLDQQFRKYRDQIRQGQNPKVTGVPQNKQYRVPNSCKA